MNTLADTLSIAKFLKTAEFTEAQADAVAEVVRKMEERAAQGAATKQDLQAANAELKAELGDIKAEIYRAMWMQTGATVVTLSALYAMFG